MLKKEKEILDIIKGLRELSKRLSERTLSKILYNFPESLLIDIVFWYNYEESRTGLDFASMRAYLYAEQNEKRDRGIYMFVSRRTVLGRLHQIKSEQMRGYKEDLACKTKKELLQEVIAIITKT